jgi:hypothetical protein
MRRRRSPKRSGRLTPNIATLPPSRATTARRRSRLGGGEAETAPTTREIAQGPIKAVLSYVEETGEDAEVMRTPAVTVFAESKEVAKLNGESIGFADPPVGVQIAELDGGNPYPEVVVSFSPEERIAAPPPAFSPQAPTARNGRRSISASSTAGPCSRPISTAMAATSS